MVKHVRWSEVQQEQLSSLLARQYISGDRLTVARMVLRKDSAVPEHSHESEQFCYVLEGALKFIWDKKEAIVRTGEVLCIPGHTPHAAVALEDSVALDIFAPPRADWANQDDAYLRAEPSRVER